MLNDKHYSQENILIHEFAHSVMCIGMDDEQRQSICGAYEEAKQSGLYQTHIYMMANADEYWAEATQSWFDATVRTGDRPVFFDDDSIKLSSSNAHSDVIKSIIIASAIHCVSCHTAHTGSQMHHATASSVL